jgi:aspartate aminotransferase
MTKVLWFEVKMQFSKRAEEIQASPIRKLMPYANEAKKKGIKVYHLNIGQPDIPTPKEMIEVYHRYDEKVLEYGPSQGLDRYRQSLVHYYQKNNIAVSLEDIIVTTAGSEAIVFALLVTCNPGDEVIIPEPFYTNYNGFASMTGVNLVPLTTHAENGFALPAGAKFEELITTKTKAIMICNPGNPTGTVYDREQLEMVASIAKKHNLYVISDEVYREFIYDGAKHTSILSIPGMDENAILVDSISKRFSACGARVGCIISRNQGLMAATLKFAQARLCPPTLDQLAATACIVLGEEYFRQINDAYRSRRDLVYSELQLIPGIVCVKPKGAFYIIAKLPIPNAEDFIIWVLRNFSVNNETVMTAPADGFYSTPGLGKDELRIAYVLNEEDLRKAMQIFRLGLNEYMKMKGICI